MKRVNKSGISPLIATVLVIGLTVVMAGIVWIFLSTTINQSGQKFCSAQQNAEIDFQVNCKQAGAGLQVAIKNVGKIPVTGFRFRTDIDKKTKTDEMEVNPGQERVFSLATKGGTITLFPVIIDEGKIFTCTDRKVDAQCSTA
jgi:FlaG/FlaF family flagellin (archaellin)